jgi:hypothetical protein
MPILGLSLSGCSGFLRGVVNARVVLSMQGLHDSGQPSCMSYVPIGLGGILIKRKVRIQKSDDPNRPVFNLQLSEASSMGFIGTTLSFSWPQKK